MYTAAGKLEKREYLEEFRPLVRRIAHYMMARLPASVELDDIMQAGMMGLLDAVDRYQGALGAQFESYAAQRIRGAILDELRQADWLPRSARRNMRRIEQAVNALEQRYGRAPTEPEIARELGMRLDQYQEMLEAARGCQLIHLEDLSESETNHFLDSYRVEQDDDPVARLMDKSRRALLAKAIDALPEREKLVMGMHYEQELNLREIGEVLGVSESRVCQLHSQAIARLRNKLKHLKDSER